jgi:hypothetical protein
MKGVGAVDSLQVTLAGAHTVVWKLLVLLILLVATPTVARADLILELMPASATAIAGDTITFSGRITNTTGVTLNATDMFLNFNVFDPAIFLNFNQILGISDFVLPNNTFSPVVSLFDVLISPTAQTGTYAFEITLQDINNISSNVVTADVAVTSVPESSSVFLLAVGITGLALARFADRRLRRPLTQ